MDSDIYLHISLQGLHVSLAHRIPVINTYQVNDDENLDTPFLKNMVMDFLLCFGDLYSSRVQLLKAWYSEGYGVELMGPEEMGL